MIYNCTVNKKRFQTKILPFVSCVMWSFSIIKDIIGSKTPFLLQWKKVKVSELYIKTMCKKNEIMLKITGKK